MKQVIRLTESNIRDLITEVVKNVLDNYIPMDMDTFESPAEDNNFETENSNSELYSLLKKYLPERDYDVITRRMNGEGLNSIANSYGFTKERIRQIYFKALSSLKNNNKFIGDCSNLVNGDYNKSSIDKYNNMYSMNGNSTIEKDYENLLFSVSEHIYHTYDIFPPSSFIGNMVEYHNNFKYTKNGLIKSFMRMYSRDYKVEYGYVLEQEIYNMLSDLYDNSRFYKKWRPFIDSINEKIKKQENDVKTNVRELIKNKRYNNSDTSDIKNKRK